MSRLMSFLDPIVAFIGGLFGDRLAEPTEGGTPSSKSTNDMRPSAGAEAQEER